MQKQFSVELGEKIRALKYDMNSLAAIEEKLGPGNAVDLCFGASTGFRAQLVLVWAGLIWETWDRANDRPTLTLSEVSDWITPILSDKKRQQEVIELVTQAFFSVFPPPDKAEPEEGDSKNA